MAYPQINYNGSNLLLFTFPPVNKAGVYSREVQRTDLISGDGVKQSTWIRTDKFLTLDLAFVPQDDLADWEAFMDWAEQGNPFAYFPDRDQPDNATFTLEDTSWDPALTFKGMVKFSMKLRLQVPDDSGS